MHRLIPCLFALLLIGCGKNASDAAPERPPTQDPQAPATTTQAAGSEGGDAALVSNLLNRIDAEPAALWLSLEPLPETLLDRLWQQMALASEQSEEVYGEIADATDDPLLRALLNELAALDSPDAWAERGLSIEGVSGLHTVGLFPLLHWEVADPDAFAAMLSRLEDEAETELPRRDIDGESVIWLAVDDLGLAIHHDREFVSAGLIADRPELLRRVANLDRPTRPLQLEQVNAFNTARGFGNDNAGFVDFQRLLHQLLDGEDEWLVEARREGGLARLDSDATCRTELGALTQAFPRKSFGSTHVDDQSISMLFRLETSSDLGLRMASMADSPVALSNERTGLLNLGLSLNLVAARDFARDIVGGWVDNPPGCFMFAGIADQAADWQLALNRPIPPLVTNLQGLRLQVDDMTITDGELEEMTATAALFMRNPQMMLGMAQMFSPELAALDLQPGGDPQPLPEGLVPNLGGLSAWMGLSDTGLGLAIGDDSRLNAALEAGQADRRIFAGGVDLGSYATLIQLGMANLPGGEEQAAEADEALALLAAIYRYMHKSIALSEDGVDFEFGFEVAD